MRYFVVRYPRAASRSRLFRLGTLDSGSAPPHSDNVFRVVTCARAEPLKRLDLLAEALRSARGEIEWTHIGNGSDMNRIRRIATEFPPGVRFVEEGYLPSWEVVERYRRKPFDVFVNVSRSEGLPVSIMEALSFGIPVVASDVGGNAEALTKDCGILLSANPSPEEVREVLEKIRRATVPERDRMRRAARAHWEIRFRGERNFGEFAVWLSELEPTATSNHD
jgi:glycosyltransferase involved in cell wall biosynthesis